MKILRLWVVALVPAAFMSCGNAEEAGRKIDRAVERAGDKIEDAGDRIEEKTRRPETPPSLPD